MVRKDQYTGEYVAGQNGEIVISNLTPGVTITAQETETASGYVLDTTSVSDVSILPIQLQGFS